MKYDCARQGGKSSVWRSWKFHSSEKSRKKDHDAETGRHAGCACDIFVRCGKEQMKDKR